MDAHELSELKGFVADLKADRAAQKEKERRESWTKYTSLSLVALAVLAAIAAQWGGKYGAQILVSLNDATFYQSSASDQWSYYQAKSIKQNLYEMRRDQLTDAVEPAVLKSNVQVEKVSARIDKYEKEKTDIQNSAKELELKRDSARATAALSSKKGGKMGLAVSIFQIAIALGSISLVVRKKPLWFLALALGMLGTAQMIYTWCC
jgi:hypothetical protein